MNSNQPVLTDFQKATAERIFEIFHDKKQNRVLLADEVGLGKTLVAKAVINKLYDWHIKEGDPLFKVVYICSNQVIAQQNASKLDDTSNSQVSITESRLSMQHLRIAEREANRNNDNYQFLALTPSTSFKTDYNARTWVEERALMYCILKDINGLKDQNGAELELNPQKLETFFRIKYKNDDQWKKLKNKYQARIKAVREKLNGKYPDKLYPLLRNKLNQKQFQEFRNRLEPEKRIKDVNLFKRFIPKLCKVFSEISLELLKPDLIIMDEFQRFNTLISCDDDSDLGQLVHKFFNNKTAPNKNQDLQTKILLLSATPYKPYSTLAEALDSDFPKHFEDFNKVFQFLYSAPNCRKSYEDFNSVWTDYSNSLQELRQNDWSNLITNKNKAEDELLCVVNRTERQNSLTTEQSSRIIKTKTWENNDNAMDISEGDFLSYYNVCQYTQQAGLPPIRIDYAESSPYLLSFMQDNYDEYKPLQEYCHNMFRCQKQNELPNDDTSFLNKDAIDAYEPIPTNNARLQNLYNEILPPGKQTEFLLWIPPSRPYYTASGSEFPVGQAFADNKGFSKLLLFSAWKMVPRMTASMLSYEAERLIFSKLNDLIKKQVFKHKKFNYFYENDSNSLKGSSENILTYPSEFLADVYSPSKYEGKTLSEILESIQIDIQEKINNLKDCQLVKSNRISPGQTLSFLKALEGNSNSKRSQSLVVPDFAVETLAYMAVASPAVCARRALQQLGVTKDIDSHAAQIAKGITYLFDRRNAQAIVKLKYFELKSKKFERMKKHYYFNVLRYCAEGNFQSMLDEYAFVCDSADQFIQNMTPQNDKDNERQVPYISALRGFTKIDTKDSYLRKGKVRSKEQKSLRFNFAMGYYDIPQTDNKVLRANTIRTAFNMPFRPFVLSTTSIGQEGLDFHAYCRKIMHWNLPQNPIDLEQREGRINRFLSLAIRQSLANSSYADNASLDDFWNNLINKVKEGKDSKDLCGGMIPYWVLPNVEEFENPQFPIERIVPAYPYSKDQSKYEWIIKVLSMYRLTLGQPNQEELLRSLDNANIPKEQLDELFFNLSPFFGKQKEKAEAES